MLALLEYIFLQMALRHPSFPDKDKKNRYLKNPEIFYFLLAPHFVHFLANFLYSSLVNVNSFENLSSIVTSANQDCSAPQDPLWERKNDYSETYTETAGVAGQEGCSSVSSLLYHYENNVLALTWLQLSHGRRVPTRRKGLGAGSGTRRK